MEGLLWPSLLERMAWGWHQVGVLGEVAGARYPLHSRHCRDVKEAGDGL